MAVQVVVGCLTGRRPDNKQVYLERCGMKEAYRALLYFNIPRELWPAGLRYFADAQQQRDQDQVNGEKFMKVLLEKLELHSRISKRGAPDYQFRHVFYLYKHGKELELHDHPVSSRYETSYKFGVESWNFHPQQLAIDLAAAEHLHIEFDDDRDKPWSSKFTVTLLDDE